MKRLLSWIGESNRWKHLVGGIVIGCGADDTYCAVYVGLGVGATLELKDKLWGGKPDCIDFFLTFIGTLCGFGLRTLIIKII